MALAPQTIHESYASSGSIQVLGNSGPVSVNVREDSSSEALARQRILHSLYKSHDAATDLVANYETHKDRNPVAVKGTCTWFLRHPKYRHWYDAPDSSLLWFSADAGCGKSVLASFLVNELRSRVSQMPLSGIVCYFFFRDDNKAQSNAVVALRALLHQILSIQPSIPELVQRDYDVKGDASLNDFGSLWSMFVAATSDQDCRVFCVLDGLDECESLSRKELLQCVASLFDPLNKSQKTSLKVIATSRPENSIHTAFRKLPSIRIWGENEAKSTENDVRLLIESNLNDLSEDGLIDEQTKDYIMERLVSNADQTFLWVSLVMSLLKNAAENGASEEEMVAVFEDKAIYGLYAKLLAQPLETEAMNAQKRKILYIILAANRPLTVEELDIAVCIREDDRSLMDLQKHLHRVPELYVKRLCGSFVSFREGKAFLVHQTAREFLISKQNEFQSPAFGPWFHSVELPKAHSVVSQACMAYLSLVEFEDILPAFSGCPPDLACLSLARNTARKNFSFLLYASEWWQSHVRMSGQWEEIFAHDRYKQLQDERSPRFWNWALMIETYWGFLFERRMNSNLTSENFPEEDICFFHTDPSEPLNIQRARNLLYKSWRSDLLPGGEICIPHMAQQMTKQVLARINEIRNFGD